MNEPTFYCRGLWGWNPLFLFLKQQGLLPIRPFVPGIWELIKVQTKDYLFISSTHKRDLKQVVKIRKDPYDLIYTLIFSLWFLEVHVSFFTILYVTCSIFACKFPCWYILFYWHTLDFLTVCTSSSFFKKTNKQQNILVLSIFNPRLTVEKISFV